MSEKGQSHSFESELKKKKKKFRVATRVKKKKHFEGAKRQKCWWKRKGNLKR